jgi:hypothetical protein
VVLTISIDGAVIQFGNFSLARTGLAIAVNLGWHPLKGCHPKLSKHFRQIFPEPPWHVLAL